MVQLCEENKNRFSVLFVQRGKKSIPKMFDNISKTVAILVITGLLTISRNNCLGQDDGEFSSRLLNFVRK